MSTKLKVIRQYAWTLMFLFLISTAFWSNFPVSVLCTIDWELLNTTLLPLHEQIIFLANLKYFSNNLIFNFSNNNRVINLSHVTLWFYFMLSEYFLYLPDLSTVEKFWIAFLMEISCFSPLEKDFYLGFSQLYHLQLWEWHFHSSPQLILDSIIPNIVICIFCQDK